MRAAKMERQLKECDQKEEHGAAEQAHPLLLKGSGVVLVGSAGQKERSSSCDEATCVDGTGRNLEFCCSITTFRQKQETENRK